MPKATKDLLELAGESQTNKPNKPKRTLRKSQTEEESSGGKKKFWCGWGSHTGSGAVIKGESHREEMN